VEFADSDETVMQIGDLIQRSKGKTGGYADRALRRHGLAIMPVDIGGKEFPYLVVANNHQGLQRIFSDTRWAEGTWRQAAARVRDAAAIGPCQFAGIKQRAMWIPLASLPVDIES
jgi:hypothetical protein